jgi:1-acyl-sn-glycerol-3-phosphate acyltransferase
MIESILAAACRAMTGPTVAWHCDPQADVQRIYFANHSSHLDFIAIWSAMPPRSRPRVRPVAGGDYWSRDPVRRYLACRVFRALLVDRNSGVAAKAEAARASIARIADGMSAGDSVIVFPEGTRSLDGAVGPFKSGLYHLARAKPAAELIPVHLENLNRILPKGEALLVPMLSRVTFGTALPTASDEPKEQFLARARLAVLELRGVA